MSTIDKKSAEVSEDKYSCLKLENQLCFPLYVCSKEVIRKYKPFLDKLDLTYTQYIAMMVLWERRETNVKEMGECLFLDSGTLTPLLKKLEQKGYIERHRSKEDERNLMITITDEGMKLLSVWIRKMEQHFINFYIKFFMLHLNQKNSKCSFIY